MKITAVDTAILRIPTRKPISLDFPTTAWWSRTCEPTKA